MLDPTRSVMEFEDRVVDLILLSFFVDKIAQINACYKR